MILMLSQRTAHIPRTLLSRHGSSLELDQQFRILLGVNDARAECPACNTTGYGGGGGIEGIYGENGKENGS